MKITIEHYGKTISVTIPEDSLLEEVVETLKGMLITTGFSVEGIREFFEIDIY